MDGDTLLDELRARPAVAPPPTFEVYVGALRLAVAQAVERFPERSDEIAQVLRETAEGIKS